MTEMAKDRAQSANVQNFFMYRNNMHIFAEFDDIDSFSVFILISRSLFDNMSYIRQRLCRLFEGEFAASSPKSLRSTQRISSHKCDTNQRLSVSRAKRVLQHSAAFFLSYATHSRMQQVGMKTI